MKTKRKAQIKMFETIAVLVVFFFLLVFGVSFYFVLQRSSLNRQIERNSQITSVEFTQKISDLPELDCALAGIEIDNCIDRIKLEKLMEALQDDMLALYYFNIFGYSRISLRTVYPEITETELYAREPESFASAYRNQIPLLIYDTLENDYAFSVLEVTTYVS
jgi:hypothetical protein